MAKHESVPQVNEVSRISLGTEIRGTLISQFDIRIDGAFDGDLVASGKLVIGENAMIKGNVICLSADVWGKIDGELIVGDTVTFKDSSSFSGNLRTHRICIEMGAIFCGNCMIIAESDYKDAVAKYIK